MLTLGIKIIQVHKIRTTKELHPKLERSIVLNATINSQLKGRKTEHNKIKTKWQNIENTKKKKWKHGTNFTNNE